jgi:hypothetical protein
VADAARTIVLVVIEDEDALQKMLEHHSRVTLQQMKAKAELRW